MLDKRKLPLIIAFSIPLLMIVLLAAFIYLPGLGKKPKYNFLYMTGNSYYDINNGNFYVSRGRLVQNQPAGSSESLAPSRPPIGPVRFYVYDVSKDLATEVSFLQAQNYTLDPSSTSADGYVVERGNYSGGDLFFGGGSRDYNTWFIKGHNRSRKLNLKLSGQDYYNVQFLGWIE